MWGQYFSEFIALAFIAMSCGTFLVGVTCATMLGVFLRVVRNIGNEPEGPNWTAGAVGDER